MKDVDTLKDLYGGIIRPSERLYRQDTNCAATMESFEEEEGWIRDKLNDDGKNQLDELISYHKTIVDTMSYENFRYGSQLGVMLMIETFFNENSVML